MKVGLRQKDILLTQLFNVVLERAKSIVEINPKGGYILLIWIGGQKL